jgi:hypothetical protein
MRRGGIELRNRTRKAHYVAALRQNDEKDLERYKTWKAEEKERREKRRAKRQPLTTKREMMFTSSFR